VSFQINLFNEIIISKNLAINFLTLAKIIPFALIQLNKIISDKAETSIKRKKLFTLLAIYIFNLIMLPYLSSIFSIFSKASVSF